MGDLVAILSEERFDVEVVGDDITVIIGDPDAAVGELQADIAALESDLQALESDLQALDPNVVVDTSPGATHSISFISRRYQVADLTLQANLSLSFIEEPVAGIFLKAIVIARQDGVGGRVLSHPLGVLWPAGVAPTQTTAPYKYDIFEYWSINGGVTWLASAHLNFSPPDTVPPSTPGSFSATLTDTNEITLTWSASSDNVGVAGYEIKRDGSFLVNVTSGAIYVDDGLAANTIFDYEIRAYDAAGNYSGAAADSASTDTTPPTEPGNLLVFQYLANPSYVRLDWDASSDGGGVVGYEIKRGGAFLVNVTGGSTVWDDTTAAYHTEYTYQVRAYDESGNYSTPAARGILTQKADGSIPVAGAVFRLDADTLALSHGDPVTNWPDQSGNGNTPTQFSPGAQPAYQENIFGTGPAVLFDGAGDYLRFGTAALIPGNELTLFGMVQVLGNDDPTLFSTRISDDANSFQVQMGDGNGGSRRVSVTIPGYWMAQTGDDVYINGISTLFQYLRESDGTNHIWVREGTEVEEEALTIGAYATIAPNSSLKLLGAGAGLTANHYFYGYMAEVILFDRALTDVERRAMAYYLIVKWG